MERFNQTNLWQAKSGNVSFNVKHNLFLKPLNALSRKLTVASVSVGIFLKKEEEEKKVLLGLFRQLPQLPLSSCACPNIWKAAAEVKLPPLRFLFYFFYFWTKLLVRVHFFPAFFVFVRKFELWDAARSFVILFFSCCCRVRMPPNCRQAWDSQKKSWSIQFWSVLDFSAWRIFL